MMAPRLYRYGACAHGGGGRRAEVASQREPKTTTSRYRIGLPSYGWRYFGFVAVTTRTGGKMKKWGVDC